MDELDEKVGERLTAQWAYAPTFLPRGQDYAVLSILAPEGTNQVLKTGLAIKIYGCFATLADANQYAERLSKECDAFDFFVLQTCEWARLPPEVASLDDVHYQQDKLEEIKKRAAGARDESAQRLRERLFAGQPDSVVVPFTETETTSGDLQMDVDEQS